MKKYSLEVAGIKRELPIIKINNKLSIASFVIIGDTEIICACAKEIIQRIIYYFALCHKNVANKVLLINLDSLNY